MTTSKATAGCTSTPIAAQAPAPPVATVPLGARRARLRTDITLAARVLPVHYPLQAFIAVNPLNGLVEQPFAQALRVAGQLYGAPGTMPEPWFRAAHASGRITDADLHAALRHDHAGLLATPPLAIGGQQVSAWALLRADLLHGTPATAPDRHHRTLSERVAPDLARTVDDLSAKWCAAFLADAAWPMPDRDRGFHPAWRALARYDRALPRTVRARLAELPERADDALLHALDLLAVDDTARQAYLQADLTRLPGWAAHVRWHTENPPPRDGSRGALTLLDYLAVRLSCEALLLEQANLEVTSAPPADTDPTPTPPTEPDAARDAPRTDAPGDIARAATALTALGVPDGPAPEVAAAAELLAQLPASERAQVWLHAYEGHYRDQLLTQLAPHPALRAETSVERPRAQVVCCIDARSEGLRRHLESLDADPGAGGGYETVGFAGFFAVAIRYTDLAGGAAQDLCPVLIAPSTAIAETPTLDNAGRAERQIAGLRVLAGGADAFHTAKDTLASPFTLAEAGGLIAGPLAATRTAAPRWFGTLRQRLHGRAAPPAPTTLTVHDAFPLPERVLYAQVALTTMGLTRGFARLVVLCGHGSTTENNPYQAALDCGACGGHRGAPNARTAAAILNDPDVRTALPTLGISIPPDTVFVAGEHDTATDRVALLDPHLIPVSHRPDLQQLARDLATAGQRLAAERVAELPGAPARGRRSPAAAARHTASRSADWAQVYPEWGLAGNAAFLIGPRSISRGLSLHRRVFLHSYDPDVDPDGTALETILTAPLVVAQWINAQYYFSTVAPHVFGAGTKTIHNVIGGAGVLAGHTGDLQLGLPWQSVALGRRLVHEPMRLLTVAQAPLERIEAIIGRNPILQQLFGNQWISLTARPDPSEAWQHYTHPGWQPWSPSSPAAPVPPSGTDSPTRPGEPS